MVEKDFRTLEESITFARARYMFVFEDYITGVKTDMTNCVSAWNDDLSC